MTVRVLCSWELALTLKDAIERFDSAGVKLIAVGVGTPDKARILAERVCDTLLFIAYLVPSQHTLQTLVIIYNLILDTEFLPFELQLV